MLKSFAIFLILSVCVFAFDETDDLNGNVRRPGYGSLQVDEYQAQSLENYFLKNRLVNTPKVKLIQYQSNTNPLNVESFVHEFIADNYSDFNLSSTDFKFTSSRFILDKFHFISLIQIFNGIEIVGSNLSIKAAPDGRVFMYGGETFTNININTFPTLTVESARINAYAGIDYDSSIDMIKDKGLFILPLIFDEMVGYRLVYRFDITAFDPRADWQVYVDAQSGEVLWRENFIRFETVSGNVSGLMQPATPFDEQEIDAFANLHIYIDGSWMDTTDADGNYSYDVPGSEPVSIDAYLEGPYLNVDNQIDTDAYFSGEVTPGDELDIFWDDSISTIPERNAFYHGQVAHDYIKSIDPDLTVMDFQMVCRVNVGGTCNAYWSRYDRSINFYRQGGGCPNIAQIADVVYHEYGHGLTNLQYYYGGHQDPNGAMHEGFSDYIACLISDQPLVGRGFFGSGSHLRNLVNDNRYPDDWNGESHHDGLIIGGALWDLKLLLDDDRPNYVDTLWHFAKYGYSGEFVGYFWDLLAVDDDDGNIENGTPHAYEIFYSFGDLHGIGPGVTVIIDHAPLIDSEDSTSAYPVEATVVSMFSMDSGSVTIYYSTGDDFNPIGMFNTSENDWYGEIPSQSYGTIVDYYIEAIDDIGMYNTNPEGAPDTVHSFYVGADVIPPTIELIEGPANTLNLYGPYGRFAIEVWDMHGIDDQSAQLHYQVNETDEVIVLMEVGGEPGEYVLETIDVGQVLNPGDVVNYWFTCRDLANNPNTGRLPETGAFALEIGVSEFIDDFEEGIDNWTAIDTGWVAYDLQGYQSENCLKSGYSRYDDNMNSLIYLNSPYDLSFFENAWLSFMQRNHIFEGDTCFVVASTSPAGPWTKLDGISGVTGWVRSYYELAGFAGPGNEQVYVGLQFISDDSGNHFGMMVDDVEIFVALPTGITNQIPKPESFILNQNYPNPFNMETIISFSVGESNSVKLEIFDVLGRQVARLLDKKLEPGQYQVKWDGKNSGGIKVTSGMYFYRLDYNDRFEVKSMILLK